MSTYTYKLSELPALGIITAPIAYASLKADSLKLRFVPTTTATSIPWVEHDRIIITETITLDGDSTTHRLFSGVIEAITYIYSGDALYIDIVVYNDVEQLSLTTYTKLQDDGTPAFAQYWGNTHSLAEANTIVSGCFSLAKTSADSLMTCSLINGITGNLPVVIGNGSSSCMSLIRTALQWSPDVYTYMSYSSDGDKLNVKHIDSLEPLTIDMSTKSVTKGLGEQLTEASYASGEVYVNESLLNEGDSLIIAGTSFTWDGSGFNGVEKLASESLNTHLAAIINATCSTVIASDSGVPLYLQAAVAGAAGNNILIAKSGGATAIALDWTSSGSPYLSGGVDATYSDATAIGTFEQLTNLSLTPRHDLIPPCVAVTGAYNAVTPSGGNPAAPHAIVYHIPKNSYVSTEMSDEEAYQLATTTAPKQTVKGMEIPIGWVGDTSTMRSISSENVAKYVKFWGRFPAFALLNDLKQDALMVGGMCIEATAPELAYPLTELEELNEEEAQIPANYEVVTTAWLNANILIDGSFPASTDSKLNVAGLKYCFATIKQNFVLTKAACGVTADRWSNFFSGTTSYSVDGVERKRRHVCLSLDCIIINRHRKIYKTGTNELSNGDDDFEEEEEEDSSTGVSEADYRSFMEQVYNDTRHLYYDGNFTLLNCNLPAEQLIGTAISIKGLNPDWEDMETPCTSVAYDPFTKRLDVTVGSREYLSIDEQVARQQAIQSVYSSAATSALSDADSLAAAQEGNESGEEEQEEEATSELISPSVTTSTSTMMYGRELAPFELYADGDTWYVAEGVLSTPDGDLVVAKREVSGGLPAGYDLKVSAVYNKTTSSYEARYRKVLRTSTTS